jgi:hypothetical protein
MVIGGVAVVHDDLSNHDLGGDEPEAAAAHAAELPDCSYNMARSGRMQACSKLRYGAKVDNEFITEPMAQMVRAGQAAEAGSSASCMAQDVSSVVSWVLGWWSGAAGCCTARAACRHGTAQQSARRWRQQAHGGVQEGW